VLDRRIRDLLLAGLAGVVAPAAIALGITVEFPNLNVLLVVAIIAGLAGVVALMKSSRLEVTVTLLAIYLGLLDGPVKLGLGAHEVTAAIPDILIGAVCLGAVLRILLSRERVRMPPLSAWVLAFIGTVLIEAFNPKTAGILKVVGGFRQQLQWLPFFVFGYVLMRSKKRLRVFFIIAGVLALANGLVASYQTGVSPASLASWGPGYRELYQPTTVAGAVATKHLAAGARVYASEGEARARPNGLGSDSGFSGGVGDIAFPCSLALLATWRLRRRWVAVAFALVFALGSVVGVAAGLGRLQVIGAVLSTASFIGFAALAGRGRKAAVALLTVAALAIPFGVGYVAVVRSGTFSRYASLESNSTSQIATHKASAYTLIPHQLATVPFGVGLGTTGGVSGFGGIVQNQVEGHVVSAETQYNLLADELGAPGLVVWVALSLLFVVIVARGMRTIRDDELAILLAAACAPFVALIGVGLSGPFEPSAAAGPYFWFAIGIAAYWFAGHRRIPEADYRPVAHASEAIA
jgi:hypothetical protein